MGGKKDKNVVSILDKIDRSAARTEASLQFENQLSQSSDRVERALVPLIALLDETVQQFTELTVGVDDRTGKLSFDKEAAISYREKAGALLKSFMETIDEDIEFDGVGVNYFPPEN